MSTGVLKGPARPFALASAVIISLLVAALAVTIWRYEHAIGQDRAAIRAQTDKLNVAQASTSFWREREAMNEFLIQPSPRILAEVTAEEARFESITLNVGKDVPAERTLAARARAA